MELDKTKDYELDEFLYSIWNFYAANLSSRTAKNYYNIVKNYIKLIKHTPIKLSLEDATKYNNYLVDKVKSGRLSYTTALMRISVMRSLCEYIRYTHNKRGIDYINYFNEIILPDADKLITTENLPSENDLNILLDHVKRCNDESAYLLFSLVIKCGLTSTEACFLNHEQFLCDSTGSLCIHFPSRKKHSQIIKLPDDITLLIYNYTNNNINNNIKNNININTATGPLFFNKHHTQLKIRDAERLLKKYILECNIKPFTLQQMRHSAIKYMLAGNATEEEVANYCGITTKWMSRYRNVVDESKVNSCIDMSVITIKKFQ